MRPSHLYRTLRKSSFTRKGKLQISKSPLEPGELDAVTTTYRFPSVMEATLAAQKSVAGLDKRHGQPPISAASTSTGYFRRQDENRYRQPISPEKTVQKAEKQSLPSLTESIMLTPREIRARLDQFVVGQDSLKKALSVAVYNHYKRLEYNSNSRSDLPLSRQSQQSDADEVVVEKSNVLLLGPTGCG